MSAGMRGICIGTKVSGQSPLKWRTIATGSTGSAAGAAPSRRSTCPDSSPAGAVAAILAAAAASMGPRKRRRALQDLSSASAGTPCGEGGGVNQQ